MISPSIDGSIAKLFANASTSACWKTICTILKRVQYFVNKIQKQSTNQDPSLHFRRKLVVKKYSLINAHLTIHQLNNSTTLRAPFPPWRPTIQQLHFEGLNVRQLPLSLHVPQLLP